MNREFLQSLGLEKEVIDSIMAEHGKTVQNHQKEAKDLEDRLEAAQSNTTDEGVQEALQEAQDERDEIAKKLQEAEGSHKETQVELALFKSGAQERYVSLLQREIKTHEDVELEEAIEKVKEQYAELFGSQGEENPEPKADLQGFKVKDTKLPQGEPKTWTVDEIMAVEDDKERRELIAKHPSLFT